MTTTLSPSFFEKDSGDHSIGVTPVPIPNTAVKTYSADDIARETSVRK